MQPLALVLLANGTNRHLDLCAALELAGARAEVVPLNELRAGRRRFADYHILALPGGFSYADALGAGKLLALDLQVYFADEIQAFVASGRPVIGICNGFQALVKAGILPALPDDPTYPQATLTFNASGHFECRWVTLTPRSQKCIWTRGLTEPIDCPVAHGEGNFVTATPHLLNRLQDNDQIALTYACPDGQPAGQAYPYNPNGSAGGVAGVCNPQGNVLGLMPHPENHIYAYQHPRRARGAQGRAGLALFTAGVRYAKEC